jgi:hypothetical protein
MKCISGNLRNCYSSRDFILKYFFRASAATVDVAGLQPVNFNHHRLLNIDLSDIVSGSLFPENRYPAQVIDSTNRSFREFFRCSELFLPVKNPLDQFLNVVSNVLIDQEHIGTRVQVKGMCSGKVAYIGVPMFCADTGAWMGVVLDENLG